MRKQTRWEELAWDLKRLWIGEVPSKEGLLMGKGYSVYIQGAMT